MVDLNLISTDDLLFEVKKRCKGFCFAYDHEDLIKFDWSSDHLYNALGLVRGLTIDMESSLKYECQKAHSENKGEF
jgi:hypothetical protein